MADYETVIEGTESGTAYRYAVSKEATGVRLSIKQGHRNLTVTLGTTRALAKQLGEALVAASK